MNLLKNILVHLNMYSTQSAGFKVAGNVLVASSW
jgi:hypothetical protein